MQTPGFDKQEGMEFKKHIPDSSIKSPMGNVQCYISGLLFIN